jgi:hypothetical protein
MVHGPVEHRTEMAASRERFYFLHPGYILLLSTGPIIAGFASGIQLLMPLLITVPSFFVMCRWLLRGKVGTAYAEMLLSCLWMSIAMVLLTIYYPTQAEKVFIKATDYVADMNEWIETGGATEGTPSLFIPEHLMHMGIIIVASFATAGFVSLFFGAIQMGYMNYYYAWLITESGAHTSAYLLGWPIWSIIRVLSFVLLAVVLAQPMLHFFRWRRFNVRQMVYLVCIAIVLEGLDIGLKNALGPKNQAILHQVMEQAGKISTYLNEGISFVT